jgi:hypothetical protein
MELNSGNELLKILIGTGHPADAHFFRRFMNLMESRGHEIFVVAREKELTCAKEAINAVKEKRVRYGNLEDLRKDLLGGDVDMDKHQIAKIIVDAGYQVHRTLAPGVLEAVYEKILTYEIIKRQLNVKVQKPEISYERYAVLSESFCATMAFNDTPALAASMARARCSLRSMRILNLPVYSFRGGATGMDSPFFL